MKDGLGSFWEVASLNVQILKGIKRAKNGLFLPILGRFQAKFGKFMSVFRVVKQRLFP